ncbi:MAG: alpha/beta fold hydrolase [Nitriliruptor sp.]
MLGGHVEPHVTTRLRASDGTPLAGTYLAGPVTAPTAVLLLHGFAANRRKPAYARLADGLSREVAVLALDLRGHGGSGGTCTLGDHEVADVEAGVRWLRALGHRSVVVVGLSMGATAAIHAVSLGAAVDAVVAVSAPAWFRDEPETEPMRRLHGLWERPAARAGLRLALGVRLAGPDAWRSPPHPAEMVAGIRVPLLVVHGADDAYFPPADADDLAAAAGGPTQLWHEPAGFGHAEDGIEPAFIARLLAAVVAVTNDGRFPRPPR